MKKIFKRITLLTLVTSMFVMSTVPVLADDRVKQIDSLAVQNEVDEILENLEVGESYTTEETLLVDGEYVVMTVTITLNEEYEVLPILKGTGYFLPDWQPIRSYTTSSTLNATVEQILYDAALTFLTWKIGMPRALALSPARTMGSKFVKGRHSYYSHVNTTVYGRTGHLNKYKYKDNIYLDKKFIKTVERES